MGDKKQTNSFAMLSQKMNQVQKSKKPNSVSTVKKSQNSTQNSSKNLKRTSSTTITIDLEDDIMSPSRENEIQSAEQDPNVPDRSYGDYYCLICDSHMNSEGMWTAHITGKRHIKNIEKGDRDPKYDDLDVTSCVKDDIKNVKDPVVGLSYVHEIRRKDVGAPPIFTCFLCQATFPTVPLIIEHVLTMKHRMNFMKENSPDDYQLLDATNLKKGYLEPLVQDIAIKLEEKFGRGSVKVKQEKQKIPPPYTYSAKRLCDKEEEKHPRKSLKSEGQDDAHSSKNKKTNIFEKNKYGRERRRYSSSEEEEAYKRPKSPTRPIKDHRKYERDYYERQPTSPVRPYRARSPPPRESMRDSQKGHYGPEAPPYNFSNSHQTEKRSSQNHHSSVESPDRAQHFIKSLLTINPKLFYSIVLLKLDSVDEKDKEEIDLISQMAQKAQSILFRHFKSRTEFLAKINNMRSSANSAVLSQAPVVHQYNHGSLVPEPSSLPNRPPLSGDLSFIKDFLRRSPSAVSSPVPPATAQPVGGRIEVPPHGTPSYAASQPYRNSSQTYQVQTPDSYQSSISAQNSYQSSVSSLQNYSSSYQSNSYNQVAAASSSSFAIPGLTMGEEKMETQAYRFATTHSSHYPSFN